MALINQARLDLYLKHNYNVLFSGLHGVGKTAIVKQTFETAGLRWKYFSASTLDPWVDFVGVPRVIEQNNAAGGVDRHLELIRPSYIQNDEVDALFFDELNRAPDKVINAIMELIQFKSINGFKLKNLKVIWAAINPEDEDDTYSVNHLDPAHLDRFQVHLTIPYKVDRDYFRGKYPTIGDQFIDWWGQLTPEIQRSVSPRRLDYAADAYLNNCRLEDFLPKQSNPKMLREILQTLPLIKRMQEVKTQSEAIIFLKEINNSVRILEMVKAENQQVAEFFEKYAELMPKELIAPYLEQYTARKRGFKGINNLLELIDKLPESAAEVPFIPALINDIEPSLVFKGVGDLPQRMREEINSIATSKPNLVSRLTNRVTSVFMNLSVTAIERAMWGMKGTQGNDMTTFHQLAGVLAKAGHVNNGLRDKINTMLFQSNIVSRTNYL